MERSPDTDPQAIFDTIAAAQRQLLDVATAPRPAVTMRRARRPAPIPAVAGIGLALLDACAALALEVPHQRRGTSAHRPHRRS